MQALRQIGYRTGAFFYLAKQDELSGRLHFLLLNLPLVRTFNAELWVSPKTRRVKHESVQRVPESGEH